MKIRRYGHVRPLPALYSPSSPSPFATYSLNGALSPRVWYVLPGVSGDAGARERLKQREQRPSTSSVC